MLQTELFQNRDGRFLVIASDSLAGHLRRGDRWEPHLTELLSRLLKPGMRVVDAGAHIGYTSVVMGNLVGDRGAVIAVEPLRIIFQLLCTNAMLNGLSNVYAVQGALSDGEGERLSMAPVNYAGGGNLMDSPVGSGGETVGSRTVDGFSAGRIDLIKIDVQGFETRVLRGAEKTIAAHRPVMLIEVEEFQLRRQGTSSGELLRGITDRNYRLVWIDNDYPVDFAAIPAERGDCFDAIMGLDLPMKPVERIDAVFLSELQTSFDRKTERFRR